MGIHFIFLWTDILLYGVFILSLLLLLRGLQKYHIRQAWRQVFKRPLAIIASMVLLMYVVIGLLDSIHFEASTIVNGKTVASQRSMSVFDAILSPLGQVYEKTYSSPFALRQFVKEVVTDEQGVQQQIYPRLQHVNLTAAKSNAGSAELWVLCKGALWGTLIFICLLWLVLFLSAKANFSRCLLFAKQLWRGEGSDIPWRVYAVTGAILIIAMTCLLYASKYYHIMGTGKIGQDIFYYTLKSIRTGLVIGSVTTLFMLPLALLLGISAGYFGGLIDDVIQYVYTTLSSIPGVLLIAASILSMQVFIANHPGSFATLAERADARLLALCFILGITSWTGLCRMLRAESLKLREVDYIQAAKALGVRHFAIISRHILPNVAHLVLIAVVLDFSSLVLAEAVLSYVGVGVSPLTISWGNMINSARLELAREPVVWWPMLSAFVSMFVMVLAINLFSDAVRDAFDPRAVRR